MLRVEDLVVRYGGITAVNRVTVDVQRGEAVLLVGANGAGKSSLINAVIGLVKCRSGRVLFDGNDITAVPCADRALMGIGYSPEGRRVFKSLTVADNILAGSNRISKKEAMKNMEWLMSAFPLLDERAQQPANQMSGGQQQIVAIARAVVGMPKLLLLDEPFLGLAPVWIRQVSDMVRELKARGTTILMTEQMAKPALKVVDRAYVVRGGEIRRSGSVAEVGADALAEEYL